MLLTGNALDECVFGAAQKLVEGGMHRYLRHTPSQIAGCRENEGALARALASSGIFLDMETDASAIRFDYRFAAGSSRNWCYFDVLVDGCTLAHVGAAGVTEGSGTVDVRVGEGEKRLTVWFPCLHQTWVGDVELAGASFVRPRAHRLRLLTLGDSITQGYDALYPSRAYGALLARDLDAEVCNMSIAGAVFNSDSLDCPPGPKPDIVTVFYGTNDWHTRDGSEFREAMRAYIDRAARVFRACRIFVITPLWRADSEGIRTRCGSLEDARAEIRAACAGHAEISVIEGDALLPHDPALYGDANLHPNDIGFTILEENLKKSLASVDIRAREVLQSQT